MKKYSEPEVKQRVLIALDILLRRDAFLLEHDVNERSISHKLAEYLQQLFPDYHVDCEHNRIGKEKIEEKWVKKVLNLDVSNITSDDEKGTTVFPDIIVHRRGEKENLLIIEMKKADRDCKKDLKKLEAYTSQQHLEYGLGCFVRLKKNAYDPLEWYKNGKKINL